MVQSPEGGKPGWGDRRASRQGPVTRWHAELSLGVYCSSGGNGTQTPPYWERQWSHLIPPWKQNGRERKVRARQSPRSTNPYSNASQQRKNILQRKSKISRDQRFSGFVPGLWLLEQSFLGWICCRFSGSRGPAGPGGSTTEACILTGSSGGIPEALSLPRSP